MHLALGALLIVAAGAGLLLYAVRRSVHKSERPTDDPDQQAQRPVWRPGEDR